MNKPNHLTPQAAAALLVTMIEKRGGIFRMRPDDTFLLDLDQSDVASFEEAEMLSKAVLGFRDEIRSVLLAQRTRH